VATNVGGISELIPENDHKNNLVKLDIRAIMDKMLSTLQMGIKTSRHNIDQVKINIPAYIGSVLHFVSEARNNRIKSIDIENDL